MSEGEQPPVKSDGMSRRAFLRRGAELAGGFIASQILKGDTVERPTLVSIPVKSEIPIPQEFQAIVDKWYPAYTAFFPHFIPALELQSFPDEAPNARFDFEQSKILLDPRLVFDPQWNENFELVLRHELSHGIGFEAALYPDFQTTPFKPLLNRLTDIDGKLIKSNRGDLCVIDPLYPASLFDESSYLDDRHKLLLQEGQSGQTSICYPGNPVGPGELIASCINVFAHFPGQFISALDKFDSNNRGLAIEAKNTILSLVEGVATTQFGRKAPEHIQQIMPHYKQIKSLRA
jgi:hypothetical protein